MAGVTYIVFVLCLSVVLGDQLRWKPSPVAMVTEHQGDTGGLQREQTSISSDYECPVECSCKDTVVVCPPGNLHVIPEGLPSNTTVLSLDRNKLTAIDRHMFRGLRLLEKFSAAYNHISVIGKGTFSDLHDLETIDLSKNPLKVSDMVNLFCSLQSHSLRGIYLNGAFENNVISLGKDDLVCLKNRQIQELGLGHNNFQNFPDEIFAGLRIFCLYLWNTTSEATFNTKAFCGIQSLDMLFLDGNNMRYFPRFSLNGTDIIPKLSKLSLDYNLFNTLTVKDMQGLNELGELSLSNIHFARERFPLFGSDFYVEPYVFGAMSSLSSLQYEGNAITLNRNQNEMFRLAAFTSLSASNLKLYLPTVVGDINFDLFRSMSNLTALFANSLEVMMYGEGDTFFRNAFQKLGKLEELYLAYNGLATLYDSMFQGCDNLVEIDLHGNYLTELHYPVFSELISLQILDLSYNYIKMAGGQFSIQNLLRLSSFEIRGNPLSCTCDLLGFLEFVRRRQFIFRDIKLCRCGFPKKLEGIPLLESGITASECVISLPVAFFVAMAISGVSLLGLVFGSFVYRYRWHVKFIYFQMKSKYFSNGGQNDFANYAYDVFVSYHAKSLHWVKSELLPILENKLNLKVCLHDRDWLAGIDIVENIVRSVNGSRKVVLVVTNAFARSQWCQLELTMAQHSLLEKDTNNLILIMMEDIHDYNMTPRLALQMKTQTYIEWDGNHVKARELFERQLEVAVRRPTTSLRQQAV